MSSYDDAPWTEDVGDLFDGVSYDELDEEDESSENSESKSSNKKASSSHSSTSESQSSVISEEDLDKALDLAKESKSELEFYKKAHTDHDGTDRTARAANILKRRGELEGLFGGHEADKPEKTKEDLEIEIIPALNGFQENEYENAFNLTNEQDKALELAEYDGNINLARRALEIEWKIDNAVDYIDSSKFTEGKNIGEAKLILAELEEDEHRSVVQELVEENKIYERETQNITTTWFQNDTLMGYDEEKGHNVRLDFYDDIKTSIDKNKGALGSMIDEAKEKIENYEIASLKSVYDADGQIDNRELESYVNSMN